MFSFYQIYSIHPSIHSLFIPYLFHSFIHYPIHSPTQHIFSSHLIHPSSLHPPIHFFIHPSTSSSTLLTTSCKCFITSTYLPFHPLTQPPLYFHQPISPSTISSTRQLNHPPTYSAIYPSTNLTIYPSTNLTIHPPPHLPIPPQSTTPRPEHTHITPSPVQVHSGSATSYNLLFTPSRRTSLPSTPHCSFWFDSFTPPIVFR